MEVPPLETDRLLLVWLSPDLLRSLLQGHPEEFRRVAGFEADPDWVQEVEWLARMRLEQMEKSPEDAPWLLRAIVSKAGERSVGYINFHGRPIEGVAEIGYSILSEHRRRGIATEAIEAMFDWATRTYGITTFRASVSPDNDASLKLIDKLGFVRVGEQIDEIDGLELVFDLERGPN